MSALLALLLALAPGIAPMPSEPLSDRLPPQNLEAERGVLGGMLIDNAVIDDCLAIVAEADFYRDGHVVLFRAIRDLWHSGGHVDGLLLAERLTQAGTLARAGGAEGIAEVLGSVPHAANATFYAEIVKQKATVRRLIEAANATLREAYAFNKSAAEQVADAQKAVLAVAAESDDRRAVDAGVAADEAMAALELRIAGVPSGLPTGFSALDDMAGGLAPGQLAIVAARPSMGKTAFAVQVCQHLAIDRNLSVLLFSLEMNRVEIADRILVLRAQVDGTAYRRGRGLSPDRMMLLGAARNEIGAARLRLSDKIASVATIASEARRCRGTIGLDLIAVDYVGLVQGNRRKGASRQEETAEISAGLKGLARDLGVPILAMSQLNREVEKREEHRPRMSDLRDTGAWEQDGDHIWLLHRPEYYDPNDAPGVAEVIVAKNRQGATGTIRLEFVKNQMRFAPLDGYWAHAAASANGHQEPF